MDSWVPLDYPGSRGKNIETCTEHDSSDKIFSFNENGYFINSPGVRFISTVCLPCLVIPFQSQTPPPPELTYSFVFKPSITERVLPEDSIAGAYDDGEKDLSSGWRQSWSGKVPFSTWLQSGNSQEFFLWSSSVDNNTWEIIVLPDFHIFPVDPVRVILGQHPLLHFSSTISTIASNHHELHAS